MQLAATSNWGRTLLRTPLVIAGVVTAVLSSRSVRLRRAIRRIMVHPHPHARMQKLLHSAIIGVDKQTITAVLGPPRIALHRGSGYSGTSPRPYIAADTWYYPLHPARQTAIVIEFTGGVVSTAHYIHTPKRQTA